MLKEEFEKISGTKVTHEEMKAIESAYYSSNILDKRQFAKALKVDFKEDRRYRLEQISNFLLYLHREVEEIETYLSRKRAEGAYDYNHEYYSGKLDGLQRVIRGVKAILGEVQINAKEVK